MLPSDIRGQIDKVWDAFWTGGISNPILVIEQITYLLFLRRLDEEQSRAERKARRTEQPIEAPIYTPEQAPLRWNAFKDLGPDDLFRLFTQEGGAFDFLRNLGHGTAYAPYMRGATFLIPTPRLLDQVVQMIAKIDMHDRDTKGDVFEYLLSKLESAGVNGQFRTPRHIIKMMVALLEPRPGEVVCDPSAGTCGFLVLAGEYMRERYPDELASTAGRKRFEESFMGMEFDPSMMRIGAMNLLLHGIERARVLDVDALSKRNADFVEQATVILANPPFKGSLDADHVLPELLTVVKTKKTELLFVALMLRGMKVGARAAVIVPDGVLFGSSKAHRLLRRELVEKQHLQGVISMPSGVFKPYAGVSTAVLLFTKTNSGGTDQVWFYDMQHDGRSLDDKRTLQGPDLGRFYATDESTPDDAPTLDALVRSLHAAEPAYDLSRNDIPDIVYRWHHRAAETDRARTDRSFLVPADDLRANAYDLSINRYKEVVYEAKIHERPAELMQQIRQLDSERADLLAALEGMFLLIDE